MLVAMLLWDRFVPSLVRRALPVSATDVQEFYRDLSITGDYIRLLKAKLPEADYPRYARNLGLARRATPAEIRSRAFFYCSPAPPWWSPPASFTNIFVKSLEGEDGWDALTYDSGYVYFISR